MKTYQIFKTVFFIAIIFLVISCGKKQPAGKPTAEQNELPPSLQTENPGIFLVQLSDKEQQELTIQTEIINTGFIDYTVAAPGVVFYAPEHASIISTPINGQVGKINKYEGSRVRKGEELFRIQSLEFGTLVSDYLQAFAEEQFQTNRLARLKQLVAETISSESELERANAEYQRAVASSKATYSKLKAIGVSDKEIKMFTESENFDPLLKIYASIDGVIEKNFVELGQSVNALENLSRVLDIGQVLIRGYLSPDDARLVNAGDSVKVSRRESFEKPIFSRVTSINPGLDENSRSVVVNILVPTTGGWPKPGENVRLEIVTSSQKEVIAIPLQSLTYDGNNAIVFIKKDKGIFEKRNIRVSEIRDKYVFVESGLSNGEEIALSNVFSLKALARFDIISEE